MALLLLVLSAAVGVVRSQAPCRYSRYLPPNGSQLQIYNPNYPNNYTRSSDCYWYVYTDPGYKITISCPEVQLDNNGGWYCGDTLSLYGSTSDGNYCKPFTKDSVNNKLVLSFQSRFLSPGGRFVCSVQVRQTCDCGWSYKTRIVGGENASPHEFPSIAALIDSRKRAEVCGGTIISQSYVVSAAHCIPALTVATTGVLVGEHDLSTGAETDATKLYRARRFLVHPGWSPKDAKNDIALVETALPMVFSARVGPACLPFNRPQLPQVGEQLTVLGWGTTSFGGPVSDVLQKARLRVVPMTQCQAAFGPSDPSADIQVCTFEQGKDSCQMDSGGPLISVDGRISRQFLAAIVSYGKGCAGDDPSVSTRVAAYLGWINNATGGEQNFCIK